MKIWKKATSAIMAIAMLGTLASCSKEDDTEIPYTVEEVLEMYADNTSIDDVLKNNDHILILEEDKEEETEAFTLLDSINRLESYIKIVDEIKSLGIQSNSQEDEEKTKLIEDVEIEDVEFLIESYKAGEIPAEDIETTKQTLKAIQEEYKTWVILNGKGISEETLKRAIKTIACDLSNEGMVPLIKNTYHDCRIGAKNYSDSSFTLGNVFVTYDDDFLGIKGKNYTITYDIDETPSYALYNLYKIQENSDSYEYSNIKRLCELALESVKLLAASELKGNANNISSKEDVSEVKQKILEKSNQD